jgi:hypothetical protein
VDATRAGFGVVDVGQEVALDIDHRPQPRRPRQTLGGQVGLADDGDRLGQVPLDDVVRHRRAVGDHERAERLQPRPRRGVADHVQRPRQRIDEDHARMLRGQSP